METMHKPSWLKIRPPQQENIQNVERIKAALRQRGLHTVCEEAHCPNMPECWSGETTATFMVLGDTCTRACKFCAVKTGNPRRAVDQDEPGKLADAIADIGLDYAVITSVDRDDLEDEGSSHIARCITRVKEKHPATVVEVLIPDFKGKDTLIKMVVDARPDVLAHNIETVRRLQRRVRDPRAGYDQSLHVLDFAKQQHPSLITKSSIMVGLGETPEEVIDTMKDLRKIGVDIITLGQYLRPSEKHAPVTEYVHPDVFARYEQAARELGFAVASGPLVRSSYKAGELFLREVRKEPSTTTPTGQRCAESL
ncbi:lipoyl synthase [Candidatus Woesearchaeota archaeon]|nr:lipoyl synthase [Candidatus Woesearchaeota archaeon]